MQESAASIRRPETFERSKLDLGERDRAYADRRRCTGTCCGCGARTASSARSERGGVDGAVLGREAFVLRFFDARDGDDRLLLVNLGADLSTPAPRPEPLLGPAGGRVGDAMWSSEDPRYGGTGRPVLDTGRRDGFFPAAAPPSCAPAPPTKPKFAHHQEIRAAKEPEAR